MLPITNSFYSKNANALALNKLNYISNNPSPNLIIDPANYLEIEAELKLSQNDTQGALRLYKEVLYIRQNRNFYYNSENHYYQLARAHDNLGKVYYLMQNYTEALKEYKSALKNYLELQKTKYVQSPDSDKNNIELVRCYRHIGVVQRDKGDTEEAIQSLMKAKALMKNIKNKNPDDKAVLEELATILFDLALALHNQASITYSEEANKYLKESADLFLQAQTSTQDIRVIALKNALQAFGLTNNYRYY